MKLKYEYAIQALADSFMAMALNGDATAQNCVLRLNKTGKTMLELLQTETSEEEMVQKLMDLYQGEESQIRASVQEFVNGLKAKDLLA